jgi:hypothetical protein
MTYLKPIFVALTVLIAVSALSCWTVTEKPEPTIEESVPYRIVQDDMSSEIKIAVSSSVTPEQLRATLKKAAYDHQDDPARDYLTMMYLSIDAYLIDGDKTSTVAAGRIRRHVPPGNPAERKKLTIDRSKDDTLAITLDEARKTIH